MCGIFGAVGNIDQKSCLSSVNSLAHRGPDDAGYFIDKNVFLGFRRLSIIDLSEKGNQPMCNEDKTIWLIFNGEIYNYKELKADLRNQHKFISSSDSEVIIHGYEKWGISEMLKRINGMFAFCIYDKKKNIVYLTRDRIGKKPLYYYQKNDSLLFASETKAFFQQKDFLFEIEEENFKNFIGFSFCPDNKKTLIKNVFKIEPATYLEYKLKNHRKTIYSYWNLENRKEKINFFQACDNLEELLLDSVKKRLVSDVPLGILLSGGLDSSLITALASRENTKIKTINISFPNSSINESLFAEKVSVICKTDHLNLRVKINDLYNEFKKNIRIYDDLSTFDPGLFSTYLMSELAKKSGLKVLLTGEGADEIFGGYTWFGLSQFPFCLIPDHLRTNLYYYSISRSLNIKENIVFGNKLNKLLNKEKGGDYFRKIQGFEIKYSLPNHYCMKLDKGSSAASVEARAPYLDYRVVDFAFNLPPEFLLGTKVYNPKSLNKYILRKVAGKYLPPEIVMRKKRGGMLPTYDILRQAITKEKEIILENEYLKSYFGANLLNKFVKFKNTNNIFSWSTEWRLWKCLVFGLWHDYYSSYGKN